MKTHLSYLTLFLLLPAILFTAVLITREPRHEGRTISQWFEKMQMPEHSAESDPGLIALKRFGTKAVPLLESKLKSHEAFDRFRAAWVLGNLGTTASNAVPSLVKAMEDDSVFVQINAVRALASIGTDREDIIPDLVARLSNTNLLMSASAATLLDCIWMQRKAQIPSAITDELQHAMLLLTSAAPSARLLALPRFLALSQDGAQLLGAFEGLLNDPNPWVREETVKVLRKNNLAQAKFIPASRAANFSQVYYRW